METVEQREERIRQLEQRRAQRHQAQAPSSGPVPSPTSRGPVELAPGRGDLTRSSWNFYGQPPGELWMINGRPVSFSKLFATQPWVGAAVMRMLTWAIRVPLKVYRRNGDDPADRIRLRPGQHPLADAIANQEGRSAPQFTMNLLGPVLVHGNSTTLVEDGARNSLRFLPKDFRYCEPIMPWRDEIQGFRFDVDDPTISVERSIDEVLHICYWSPRGPLGVSPLEQLGVTLQIEDAAQRFVRGTFQNGARPPSAIVATPEWLQAPEEERQAVMDQLRADLTALYAGPENAGKPALLPPGLTWAQVGHSSVEAELMEQRKVNREETAAVYQIPPPMMGILDKATYSNIQTQREMIYTDCLGPPLILFESAMNSQVVWSLMAEPDVFVEFDFGAVLRGDRLEEIGAIREAIGSALFSPNEGRGILNMPKDPRPGMDEFYLPFNNLQPVGTRAMPPLLPAVGGPAGGAWEPRSKRLHVKSRDRDYTHELEPA